MAIKFPDSITQNNSNYITVSATDGDVQGIYFVANTTERDNIGDSDVALDNHRVLGALVYVGTTPYLYTGVDISDAEWQNASNWAQTGSAVSAIDDLTDVTITAVASNEVLLYTGAGWENQTLAEAGISAVGHTHTYTDITDFDSRAATVADSRIGLAVLDDLNDVVETTITTGDVLRWNGTNWVNYADSNFAAASHTHVKADITDFSDADYATAAQGTSADTAFGWGDHAAAGYLTNITGESVGDLSDVTVVGAATGHILRYTGTAWVNIDMGAALALENIGSLADVDTAGATNGSILQYNSFSAKWFDQSVSTVLGFGVLNDLSDVTETTITTGDVLRWNGSAWVNYADSNFATSAQGALADSALQSGANISVLTNDSGYITGITGESISDLSDVITAGQTAGDILYDASGGTYANANFGVISNLYSTLTQHSDVTISGIASGELLKWNGSAWVNNTLAEAGIAAASHTHVIADITDYTTPTLDDVTSSGNSTTNDILVGEVITTGGAEVVGESSTPYLSPLSVTAGASSVFLQDWNNSSGTLKAYVLTDGKWVGSAGAQFAGHISNTVTGLSDGLKIVNTDNTAGVWSAIQLHRNSSTPADDDSICSINFNGEDSSSVETTYASIQGVIRDTTNATEDGGLLFRAKANNAWTNAIEINADDATPTTTINNFSNVSKALEVVNAGGTTGINVEFDCDMKTTSTNTFSFNYVDAAGDARNFMRAEDAKTVINNRTANSDVEIRANGVTAGSGGESTYITVDGSAGKIGFHNNAYKFPTADGTANQVLQTDGSGNLSFATPSGGGSAPVALFQKAYRTFANTTEDLYYWLPGDDDYGKDDFIAENLASLPTITLGVINYGHIIPSGTHDLEITFQMSITDGSGNNNSAYNSTSPNIRFYKMDQASGWVQIGTTQTLNMDATDTSIPKELTYTLSSQTFAVGERFACVLQGTQNVSTNTFVMWGYNVVVTPS